MQVFLLLTFISLVQGLYEDQINKFDWKKEYIGKIEDVTFDASLSVSKNLYVVTEKNVLASLSAKNGQLNWRNIGNEKFAKVMQYTDGILTISHGGIVRIWDQSSGLLKWDVNLPYENKENDGEFKLVDMAILEMSYTEGNVIVVLSTTALYTIRVQTGAKLKFKLKSFNVDCGPGTNPRLLVDSQSKQILVLMVRVSSYISATFYDAKSLEVASEKTIPASWLEDAAKLTPLESSRLVYVSKGMDALYVLDLLKGVEASNIPLSTLEISSKNISLTGTDHKDITSLGEDFFIVSDEDVIHLRLNDDNKISVVARNSATTSSIPSRVIVKSVGSEQYYFVASFSNRALQVTAADMKTGKVDKTLDTRFELPPDVGDVENMFINMFLKRTSPVGYRVLLVTSDDSVLMLTQPTRLAWSREESLASVVAAEMLDLPLSDIEAGIEVEFEQAEKHSIIEMFINRVSAQIGQVRAFAKHLTRGIKEGTLFEKKMKDPLIQVEGLTRDPFSLHKMLLLVTEKGKLFGVDSLTGEIIWRFNAMEMNGLRLRLYVQRTTAHFPNPPSALLFGSSSKPGIPASVLGFNPITGDILSRESISGSDQILQVMLLPFSDSAYLRPLLMLDENLGVSLVPDTEEIRLKLDNVRESTFLYTVNRDTGLLRGYSFANSLKMQVTWSIQIPTDQEVLSVEGRSAFEKVDSMGRPLANRSVLYKYLNPNLIAVVTGSKVSDSDTSHVVTMYLIDGISGRIIHTAVHKKASGPVFIVHSENWVLYSFWNTKARRTELASIELYEGKQLYNSTTFSSFDSHPGPLIIQQAYIFPATINAMGVSKTERGLTSRQILIGMTRGGILGMPRRMFDPRRPLHVEQSHKEEGLIPYGPEIQIPPGLFLNYNKTIQGITGIYSCPSALESTSIVLVTGLDIFFTRTQPSKMFDVLKDDFDHLLIASVVTGMFIAAIVTRKLAQNKKLNKAWR